MVSHHYKKLDDRRARLRKIFVPKAQNPSGVYKRTTKEKAFAHVVLMHAEIEAYIEKLVQDVCNDAVRLWRNDGTITRPLASILAYREGGSVGFSDDIFSISSDKKLETIILKAKDQFDSRVRGNHGIRASNLSRLFMSIGYIPDNFIQPVIASLDGFGAKRGDFAHNSPTVVTYMETDPITEANEIDRLVNELRALDEDIIKYRRDCGLEP